MVKALEECPLEESYASGMSRLVVTKDTTLKLSWGALAAIVLYIGGGTWWLSELRNSDRTRLADIETAINRRVDSVASDLNYTAKTLTGYTNRMDRFDEALQELKLVRHQLEKSEHAMDTQDKRMSTHEFDLKEVQRKAAENAIVIDYLLRWVNPTPTEPFKKRNDVAPPSRFGDAVDGAERQ